jgi:hypothetical protein
MQYEVYLFSNLLKLFDFDFDELSYDYQYDEAFVKYEEFDNSEFNVGEKPLYECMVNYLRHKYNAPQLP